MPTTNAYNKTPRPPCPQNPALTFCEKVDYSARPSRVSPRVAPSKKWQKPLLKPYKPKTRLIVEAGTGTGKTYGYLIPILLAEQKTIISTGTKNLQDQLFFIDIPVIKNIMATAHGISPKVVLLKGRANYLCINRLENARADGRFGSRELVNELNSVYEWSALTEQGDIAELASVPEDSQIWSYVTSTADNCLNQDCEFYQSCYVMKARQQALGADIVIVNHHLFFC